MQQEGIDKIRFSDLLWVSNGHSSATRGHKKPDHWSVVSVGQKDLAVILSVQCLCYLALPLCTVSMRLTRCVLWHVVCLFSLFFKFLVFEAAIYTNKDVYNMFVNRYLFQYISFYHSSSSYYVFSSSLFVLKVRTSPLFINGYSTWLDL